MTLLSRGVPMISGGDEIGRTQAGNTNAYCQDTELSWHDWASVDTDFLAFVRRLTALRGTYQLHPAEWLTGGPTDGGELDAAWFGVDGEPVADWHDPALTTIQLRLAGDPDVLAIANTGTVATDVVLPPGTWNLVVDTAEPDREGRPLDGGVLAEAFAFLVAVAG
jgi:pullulanase/glycogen debranching enzyme